MTHRGNIKLFGIFLTLLLIPTPSWNAVIDYVEVVCPVSGHGFFGMKVSGVNTLKLRDGDFLLRVEGGNHYATRVWSCPYCFFSAYPEVFEQGEQIDFDPMSIEKAPLTWEAQESQNAQRLIPVAVKYRNAAAYYYSIGKHPYFMGFLNLQGSWASRLANVSLPRGAMGVWHQVNMRMIKADEHNSEEEKLEAMAEAFRAELESAESEAEQDELTLLLASALRQSGQHRHAIPLLRDLLTRTPPGPFATAASDELELAVSERDFQREALRYFKEAVKLKETLPEDRLQSIYLIGELSRRLGDFKQAEKWFKKSTESPMPQRWARYILDRQKNKLAKEMAAR
jgi:tetratricopeptide (TPR) repeat protein